jgi:hypothetical protein
LAGLLIFEDLPIMSDVVFVSVDAMPSLIPGDEALKALGMDSRDNFV